MSFEFEYDPSKPGTKETGLPPARALPPEAGSINADQVSDLMKQKAEEVAFNADALSDAYVEHEGVMLAFDTLIERVEKLIPERDSELARELHDLRARRQTMDRLLFTDGGELRKDFTEGRI